MPHRSIRQITDEQMKVMVRLKEAILSRVHADLCRSEDVLYVDPSRIELQQHVHDPNFKETVVVDGEPIGFFEANWLTGRFQYGWHGKGMARG